VLGKVVSEAAGRFGDSPLLVTEDGRTLSYTELDQLSDEVAAGLDRRGLRAGDVVSLLLPSGPSYVVAYVAAAKIGAVTAGVNERLSAPEQAACLEVARPSLVLADTGPSGVASAAAALELAGAALASSGSGSGSGSQVELVDTGVATAELLGGLRVNGGSPRALPEDPDRPVAIVFTSGTTGIPKGAVFCGRQLDAISEIDGGRRFGGGGRALGSTSMAHLATMTKLPQTIRSGGTTFLMRRWSAGEALRAVERHRITSLGGIPTQVALMLRHELFAKTDHASIRAIALGGGPSAPALVREAREHFGVPVVVRYTCTEAGVGTGTLPDDPPDEAEETVGRARAGIELTIRGSESEVLPAGEIGEVCLRSAAVMAGYYGDPDATAAVMTSDGAVRTGDLGWVDDRGLLHLCGRAKEMYVRGGYNVFPLEVEAVLCEHPGVAHVAVAPRSDLVMGEIGVAVVVARDPASPPDLDDLRRFANSRLAHHKLPEDILVVDEIPRTAMEKIDRRSLQRLVGGA
jgi:acyl-CoA synthetase (AMP-forming)/AMP-acid ligase II